MLRYLQYANIALAFGWTKDQIDAQPARYIDRLIPICNLIREVRDGGG